MTFTLNVLWKKSRVDGGFVLRCARGNLPIKPPQKYNLEMKVWSLDILGRHVKGVWTRTWHILSYIIASKCHAKAFWHLDLVRLESPARGKKLWKKSKPLHSFNLIWLPIQYVIPKSLKVDHWLSEWLVVVHSYLIMYQNSNYGS